MTATVIKHLIPFLPNEVIGINHRNTPGAIGGQFKDKNLAAFVSFYGKLDFGFFFAQQLAAHKCSFPGVLESDDHWVFRAYLYMLNPGAYGDATLRQAIALTTPEFKHTRNIVHALLITEGVTHQDVADRLDQDQETWTEDVITAYEKLFFNVLDRRRDREYIRQIVYPETKIVEYLDNYLRNEDLGKILLRAGFNNDAHDVMHFSGLTGNSFKKLNASEIPAKLEAAFMLNGYMLARNGLLNQTADAVGIYHSRTLLAAAKQGGEGERHESPMDGIGSSVLADLQRVKIAEANEAIAFSNTLVPRRN